MEYYEIEMEDGGEGPTANWGRSFTLLYEVDEAGWVVRQIEIYNKGRALFYDQDHAADEFGELYDQPISGDNRRVIQPYRITRNHFERAWRDLRPRNR